MITNIGYTFISSTAFLLTISYFLNLSWLYYFSFVALLLILFEAIIFYSNKRKLKNLSIKREMPDKVLQGDKFEVFLKIINKNNTKVGFLIIKDTVPYGFQLEEGHIIFYGELEKGENTMKYIIYAYQNGLHEFSDVDMSLYDPLMLFVHKKSYKIRTKIKVIPRTFKISRIPLLSNMIGTISVHTWKRKGFGSEFYSIREYEYGDELKNISWRSVALSPERRLYTIQRAEESKSLFILAIDVSKTMNEGIEKYRKFDVISTNVSSFAEFVLSNGDEIHLYLFSKDYLKKIELKKKEDLYYMFEILGEIYPSNEKDFTLISNELKRNYPSKSQIVLISDTNISLQDFSYLTNLNNIFDLNLIVLEYVHIPYYDAILKSYLDYISISFENTKSQISKLKIKIIPISNLNLTVTLLKLYLLQKSIVFQYTR